MLRRILFSVAMVAMVGGARAADASVPVVGPTTYTFSACAGGSVSFTTAMTVATYECTATAETYPYTVVVSAKTTTAVTFEIYNLVAVSSAQTVPVDYSCAV